MSYDIIINSDHKAFSDYLLTIGALENNGFLVMENEDPYLHFEYSSNIIKTRFFDNHYNVIYMYYCLVGALAFIDGFTFEDPQMNMRFNSNNEREITYDLFLEIAKKYAESNTAFESTLLGIDVITSPQDRIPVDYLTLHRITDDKFRTDYYYNEVLEKENIEAYFPRCTFAINKIQKSYYILYTWPDFINILFPAEIKIDYVMLINTVVNEDDPENYVVKYDELKKNLPPDRVVEHPAMGKRDFYIGHEENTLTTFQELRPLEVKLPKGEGYLLDKSLITPYSVVR